LDKKQKWKIIRNHDPRTEGAGVGGESFKENFFDSMNRLELDKGRLCYTPTKVIYKGKQFDAPVFLTTLQSWDYIRSILRSGEYKN